MIQDILNREILSAALGDAYHVLVFPECGSTNAEARRLALANAGSPCVIAAESQTAGRGRMERKFLSPAGTGIYFSVLFSPAEGIAGTVGVTCAAAVAVMRAIRETCGIQTDIKWVNDLQYKGKKICGILAESFSVGERGYTVIGIGVNLRPMEFPPELCNIAGSLGDTQTPRCQLIAQIVKRLDPFLKHPSDRSWLEDYRRHSCVIGKKIRWSSAGDTQEGVAEGIDEDGGLIVRSNGSVSVLRSGEISVRVAE